jgi:hypothetical protein
MGSWQQHQEPVASEIAYVHLTAGSLVVHALGQCVLSTQWADVRGLLFSLSESKHQVHGAYIKGRVAVPSVVLGNRAAQINTCICSV